MKKKFIFTERKSCVDLIKPGYAALVEGDTSGATRAGNATATCLSTVRAGWLLGRKLEGQSLRRS